MNREEAKKILDQVRQGADWSVDLIRQALTATGDLEPYAGLRSPLLDQEVQGERQCLGWGAGSTVVGASVREH